MSCSQFEEIVHGLVRLELFDVSIREAAFTHARNCERCARLLLKAGILAEACEGLAEASRAEETPSYVELALLASFREHHRRVRRGQRILQWEAIAAAAILLLAAWISYRHRKTNLSAKGDSTPSAVVASRSVAPATIEPGAATPDHLRPTRHKATPRPHPESPSTAADFFPLPFGQNLEPDEPGLVVRVQLTPEALSALGYPVNEADSEHLLVADVLISDDGWPQAVRLVR